MAINLNGTTGITTTGLTSNGIDDNSTSTAMTLDSSGRVGIGTSSPDNSLHVSYADSTAYSDATGDFGIQIENTDTTTNAFSQLHFRTGNSDSYIRSIREGNNLASLAFLTDDGGATGDVGEAMRISSSGLIYINGDGTGGRISGDGTGGLVLQDGNGRQSFKILSPASGSSDAMTLDASGNLLVGTTASQSGLAKAAVQFDSGSQYGLEIKDAGAGTVGTAISLYRGSSQFGTIGVTDGDNLVISSTATDHAGLKFNNTAMAAFVNNASSDGTMSIGTSVVRFKDLYLSGGIEIENGSGNVGVGKQALNSNTGDGNTAVGYQASYSLTSGTDQVSVGARAGYSSQTSNDNTFIGNQAGYATTGGANTFVGVTRGGGSYGAGRYVTTGSYNTILGAFDGNQGGLDIRTSDNNIVLSDGDGNPRVVVNSIGRLGVNRTDPGAFISSSNAIGSYCYESVAVNQSGTYYHFDFKAGATVVGTITSSGSSTSYNTTSDYRLKENVVELTGATERLKQLEPKRFNFIADADTTVDGFLAHEAATVVPEAVTGTHNKVDADGNPEYQGIDQSKLVPLLVATIQELEARITALENA